MHELLGGRQLRSFSYVYHSISYLVCVLIHITLFQIILTFFSLRIKKVKIGEMFQCNTVKNKSSIDRTHTITYSPFPFASVIGRFYGNFAHYLLLFN